MSKGPESNASSVQEMKLDVEKAADSAYDRKSESNAGQGQKEEFERLLGDNRQSHNLAGSDVGGNVNRTTYDNSNSKY